MPPQTGQNKTTETMKKTIHEWFLEAKANGADWADAAIENAIKLNARDVLNTQCISTRRAISMAFAWLMSPEGHDYWENVWQNA